jgi:hypothetical protein
MRFSAVLPLLLVVFAILASSVGASAHHSFAATYNENDTVEIAGTMVQFSFRNPHSFVQVEVTDEAGETVRWAVEWGGSTQLRNTGVENDTLRYGDQVVITGNPGRNPRDHRIRMRTVTRPDGFSWGDDANEVFD